MTQKEAIKRVYGIVDENLLLRVENLRENINDTLCTNWSTLFTLDLLCHLMTYNRVINLINANINEKDQSNFSKRVEVFLNMVSEEEIIAMISKFLDIEMAKSSHR